MINDNIVRAVVAAADKAGIDRAALLAVVEQETSGKPFEQDGRTPTLLYERHIAYREAKKRGVLDKFVKAGLAIPKWSKNTQYKDQGSSAARLDLIRRAREIDEEVANLSASWGLGQTMGFNYSALGFKSATDMVDYMVERGIEGQIGCMIGEIKRIGGVDLLNAKNFTRFARLYNGPGYAENKYDIRIAAAYKRWSRQVDTAITREAPPAEQKMSQATIKRLQQRLQELGYHEVGLADGKFGSKTAGAISAFQHHEGLPITGSFDAATVSALDDAEPRLPSPDRADATVDDLKGSSRTIDTALAAKKLGVTKAAIGGATATTAGADQLGFFDAAQDVADKAYTAKSTFDTFHDLIGSLFHNPLLILIGVLLVAAGIAVYVYGDRIKRFRLEDFTSGRHEGA